MVELGKVALRMNNENYKQQLIEELEQIKQVQGDKDGKFKIVSKEDIKNSIGRSPDFADALMMRMLFEVAPRRTRILQDSDNTFGLA